MKKILRMMGVLLALGMLFVGCAQPKDTEEKEIELTAADLDGAVSWLIGTWKMDVESVEITFKDDASAEIKSTKSKIEEESKKNLKQVLPESGMGDKNITNDEEARTAASGLKNLIIEGNKVTINEGKTKMLVEVTLGEEDSEAFTGDYVKSMKVGLSYTKQ